MEQDDFQALDSQSNAPAAALVAKEFPDSRSVILRERKDRESVNEDFLMREVMRGFWNAEDGPTGDKKTYTSQQAFSEDVAAQSVALLKEKVWPETHAERNQAGQYKITLPDMPEAVFKGTFPNATIASGRGV